MRTWGFVLVLLGLLAADCVHAADAPAPTSIERRALQDDVDVLQQAYETMHPGLYRYNTPESMRAHFAALRADLNGRRSLADTYLALSRFAAQIRCGHTYANFYNQPRAIQHALFEHDDRVPFRFRWIDGKMVITQDYSGNPVIRPGTQVLAIDGMPAEQLLARMMAMARADGSNDAKRRTLLEVQGTEKYETFDVYLSLLRPATSVGRHYRVKPFGAAVPIEIELKSLSYATRLAQRTVPDEKSVAPAWTLDLADPRLAVLKMPSWALYNSSWDWQGFLQRSFEQLDARKVPALVIDLRGNEGGMDVGNVLLAHFLAAPRAFPQYRRLVRYRTAPQSLGAYLDTWDPSFKDWGDAAQPYDDRFYLLKRGDDVDGNTLMPLQPRYSGRVFVLVGASNSSATFEFGLRSKIAGVATLVGQTTGGNRRGINGGAFFFLRLPNTGLEMDLPLIGQFAETDEPDAGLEPDVSVTSTLADIAASTDVEMAAVRTALSNAMP